MHVALADKLILSVLSDSRSGPLQSPLETAAASPADAQAQPAQTAQPPRPEPVPIDEALDSNQKSATLSPGARLLAEKHGIDIPDDWPYATRPPVGERVEKPIRMRVRRYCHECQTAFGSEKVCSNCNHKRCVDCPRSPP